MCLHTAERAAVRGGGWPLSWMPEWGDICVKSDAPGETSMGGTEGSRAVGRCFLASLWKRWKCVGGQATISAARGRLVAGENTRREAQKRNQGNRVRENIKKLYRLIVCRVNTVQPSRIPSNSSTGRSPTSTPCLSSRIRVTTTSANEIRRTPRMRRRDYFWLVECSVGGNGDAEPAWWEWLDKHSQRPRRARSNSHPHVLPRGLASQRHTVHAERRRRHIEEP
ncbi:hypothetical protein B0H13DRAFT_2031263 [Mycena leptocephala]|nr:hypothetical protein B0H13DRAFT_2031263 [Mycena leptocephala]